MAISALLAADTTTFLVIFIWDGEESGKASYPAQFTVHIWFATSLFLGFCHAKYHLWIAILQGKKGREE